MGVLGAIIKKWFQLQPQPPEGISCIFWYLCVYLLTHMRAIDSTGAEASGFIFSLVKISMYLCHFTPEIFNYFHS
jgi:hypothetical protein